MLNSRCLDIVSQTKPDCNTFSAFFKKEFHSFCHRSPTETGKNHVAQLGQNLFLVGIQRMLSQIYSGAGFGNHIHQRACRSAPAELIHGADTAGGDAVNAVPDKVTLESYVRGATMDEINEKAMLGTLLAHRDGGTDSAIIDFGGKDAYSLGELIYFFFAACAVSGYILEVNPFDQPGVEAYKKNMFALLGKPGYEEGKAALMEKIASI